MKNNEEMIEPMKRGFVGNLFSVLGALAIRLGTKFEIRGRENLPENTPYILAPNHETYVDGLIVSMGLSRKHRKKLACLAAKELKTSHGLFGKIIMRVGRAIPIDRKGSALLSMKISIKQVEDGNIVLIHPEGTRTPNGELGRIQNGTAFIAKHANSLIVPCFIDGGYEIYSRHMKRPRFFRNGLKRKRLILSFGKPIDPNSFEDTRDVTKALSASLHNFYDNKVVPRVYEDENLEYMQNLEKKLSKDDSDIDL